MKIDDFFRYSFSKHINVNFIEETITKDWDWKSLSSHSSIKMDFIEQHIDLPWDQNRFLENPNLTYDFVKKYKGEIKIIPLVKGFSSSNIIKKIIKSSN